ncbi:MAG: hypothetical protein QNJ71_04950 [Acidimicrobiia bacterium]|nr:hypothetical protein [Acidimicrobiia bacterium]
MADVRSWVGLLFVVAGVVAVFSALPLTHALASRLPQWTLTRADVDRLGSTTFLVASIGLLLVCAGVALMYLGSVDG